MKQIVLMLMIFALTGCGLHKSDTYGEATMVDGSLLRYPFKLTDVKSVINASGFMELQVTGKGSESKHKTLEYQVDWFDANGMTVHSDRADQWRQFPVFRKQDFSFIAIAPNPRAKTFKIYIRDPQNNTYEAYDSSQMIQERY